MEEKINELKTLAEEFERILVKIAHAPETNENVESLKRSAICVEGKIEYAITELKSLIFRDDRISSDKRLSYLDLQLNQLGINLDQFRIRRRASVNAANVALKEMSRNNAKQTRQLLLGDESKLAIERATRLKSQTASALASETTARLQRTRDLIAQQVSDSEQSINLMVESTAELSNVSDAAIKVENAQSVAVRSLAKLRIYQNWDRWLLYSSFIFFGCAVAFVLLHKGYKVVRFFYRILSFILKVFGIVIPIDKFSPVSTPASTPTFTQSHIPPTPSNTPTLSTVFTPEKVLQNPSNPQTQAPTIPSTNAEVSQETSSQSQASVPSTQSAPSNTQNMQSNQPANTENIENIVQPIPSVQTDEI